MTPVQMMTVLMAPTRISAEVMRWHTIRNEIATILCPSSDLHSFSDNDESARYCGPRQSPLELEQE